MVNVHPNQMQFLGQIHFTTREKPMQQGVLAQHLVGLPTDSVPGVTTLCF